MEQLCTQCKTREECVKPCKAVDTILWKDNRIMERHHTASIVCYPVNREIHFSELKEEVVDQFSEEDVVPWSSEDLTLRKTIVFVERFFNKVPCKELAERFGVKENTIVVMYAQAVEQLEKIIDAMDARREGLKACKKSKFTKDQKFFLLIEIFGFNGYEVGKMFGLDHRYVSAKVKRMTDKYRERFEGEKAI